MSLHMVADWSKYQIPPNSVDTEDTHGAADQRLEGKKICIELIQRIHEIEGVAGVHVMAYRQEETVSETVRASGVLKSRTRPAAVRH